MEKQMLRCDICGGTLKMQANREAVCESCGMVYSIESLREKFDGLKISVTGSRNDVTQWKELLNTYLSRHDYSSAESVVKKILEAIPSDSLANDLYLRLQDWKYCEVRNNRLVEYSGKQTNLVLPPGITDICNAAFRKNAYLERIELPSTLTIIGDEAFCDCKSLREIIMPEGVLEIGSRAFAHDQSIELLQLPSSLKKIGDEAFYDCKSLREILISEGVLEIGCRAFAHDQNIELLQFPSSLEKIGNDALLLVPQRAVTYPGRLSLIKAYDYAAYEARKKKLEERRTRFEEERAEQQREKSRQKNEQKRISREQADRQSRGRCPYCGGEFKGILIKVCRSCGKTKDY